MIFCSYKIVTLIFADFICSIQTCALQNCGKAVATVFEFDPGNTFF